MNKFIMKQCTLLCVLLLLVNLICAKPFRESFNKDNTLIVLDSSAITGMPDRYRDIPNLNISGSAQFTKSQIENLKKSINKPNICIVDLRQESHGLVNDYAISFYDTKKVLNNGFTTEDTIKKENSELSKIKINSTLNIYNKTGRLFKEIIVNFVSNESSIVTDSGMKYERFAVRDNGTPTAMVVDNFVEFIKNKPSDLHLHIHCDAGEGRTTTFMSMYQAMMNETNLSLDQILAYQYNIGGIILTDNKDRAEFLKEFYNYVLENKGNNYQVPYSTWIISK